MSLRVWLPLNGDLHNQGISNVNITSTESSVITNGKIGSCMKITTTTNLQYIPDFNISGLSLCGWFKFNQAELATVIDALNYTSSATTPTGNLIGNTSYGGIGLIWTGNNHYSSGTFSSITAYATLRTGSVNKTTAGATISFDTWTHLTLTWSPDSHILSLYKDGIFIGSQTFTQFSDGVSRVLYLNYKAIYGGNGPSANIPMYCNDIRVYDHCLSAAEVREIANGLVLHYKLDNNGCGGRNLVRIGTGAFHNTDQLTTLTWSGWDSYNSLPLTDMDWNNRYGQQITYSCYVENIEQTAGTGSGIMLHVRYADGTYQQFGGGKNGTQGQYLAQGESGWLKLTVTIPDASTRSSPTTINRIEVSVRHNSSGGASTIKYKCPQAELGNKQTAWYWAPEDTQEDITIVEDSSGYNYNGSILNTVRVSSDTARYGVSTNLVDGNSAINCGRAGMVTDSITVNFWIKSSAWANPVSCTEGGGWNFEATGNYFRFPVYISGVGYKYGQSTHTKAQVCDNKWHMLTGVYDRVNQKIKIYVDGELDNEYATETSNIIGYNSTNVIWLGAEASGSATAIGSNGMAGLFSDFRIYCTPLLDTDIKQLYNVSMKIDKQQQIHAFESSEHLFNMMYKPNFAIGAQLWQDGLNRYTQSNCQVNLTNNGLQIYRPAGLNQTDNGNTMYGGLKIVNSTTDNIHAYNSAIDNIFNLQKGHTYIWIFHVKGDTTNAPSFQVNNNMGWGGGGLTPTPSNVVIKNISTNFNGEAEVWYKFTINDEIVKTCTSAYSSFVANNQYLSYKHFGWNWSYATTGNGTNIYVTNIRLYDITNIPIGKITKTGIAKFSSIFEVNNIIHLNKNEDLILNQFIER